MAEIKLNTLIKNRNLKFGDFILFQDYERKEHDGKQYIHKVSKPILAIYLGEFVADQTIGFNYVRWINEDKIVENKLGFKNFQMAEEIEDHVEWNDFIDILGHWEKRPNWKEILEKYRLQNTKEFVKESEIFEQ